MPLLWNCIQYVCECLDCKQSLRLKLLRPKLPLSAHLFTVFMQYTKCENQLDTISLFYCWKPQKNTHRPFFKMFSSQLWGSFPMFSSLSPARLLGRAICALYMTDDVNSHFLSNCANLFMPVYLLWISISVSLIILHNLICSTTLSLSLDMFGSCGFLSLSLLIRWVCVNFTQLWRLITGTDIIYIVSCSAERQKTLISHSGTKIASYSFPKHADPTLGTADGRFLH